MPQGLWVQVPPPALLKILAALRLLILQCRRAGKLLCLRVGFESRNDVSLRTSEAGSRKIAERNLSVTKSHSRHKSKKQKLVIVVGATASGKSHLGVALAKEFDGEVISADSRQVYRGLDIGTAKATPEEMAGVPHHLIDIADVDTVYSATDFKRDAEAAIEDITSRGKLPLIVGGTFFYIDVLLGRVNLPDVPPDPMLRAHLEEMPHETLYRQLEELDPERAFKIDPHNKRRLVRALEIIHAVGKVPESSSNECPYDVLTIGLEVGREELRSRYESRAREWLERGFKEEVERLLGGGVSRDRLHEIGFEYRLMLEHLDGALDEEQFVQRFIEKNWQYAKRQLTWLRRDKSIEWFSYGNGDDIVAFVQDFLRD